MSDGERPARSEAIGQASEPTPPGPGGALSPELREAIERHLDGLPEEQLVHGVTSDGRPFRLVRIPLPEPCDVPAPRGPVRLGTMAHLGLRFGLGDLDD